MVLALSSGAATGPRAGAPRVVAVLATVGLLGPRPAVAFDEVPFVDVTVAAGVDFVHENGRTGRYRFAEMMGSGLALFDADGDGDPDLYLVQGGPLEPGGDPSTDPTDHLYLNVSDAEGIRLRDATAGAGLASTAFYGMGVAAGDADVDGDVDLYVTGYGEARFLRNRGDGTFEDATSSAGLADRGWSVSASWIDLDRDGFLDLFVVRYVDATLANHVVCRDVTGGLDYCAPSAYSPVPDRVFRNRGDGTFEDVTAAWLDEPLAGSGLGVVGLDVRSDGLPDLYVANDLMSNHLWTADGGGTPGWSDEALLAGVAASGDGELQASMGVVAADLDGDGNEDLFLTHLARQTNTLYLDDGTGVFRDRSVPSGLGNPSWPFTGFGTVALDVDHDGHLDLAVANGAVRVRRELVDAGDPFPLHEPNQLFRGLGGGRFEDVSARSGPPFEISEVSRGLAAADLDGDGDLDLALSNNGGPARVLANRLGQRRPWLVVRALTGTPSRDALGARVRLGRPGAPDLVRRVRTDGSYASATDPRVHFGLGGPGSDGAVGPVRIDWPSGRAEVFDVSGIRRVLVVREGQGDPTATVLEKPPTESEEPVMEPAEG